MTPKSRRKQRPAMPNTALEWADSLDRAAGDAVRDMALPGESVEAFAQRVRAFDLYSRRGFWHMASRNIDTSLDLGLPPIEPMTADKADRIFRSKNGTDAQRAAYVARRTRTKQLEQLVAALPRCSCGVLAT